MLGLLLLASSGATAAPTAVHANAAFAVREQLGIPYAEGVICNAKPCKKGDQSCQKPAAGAAGKPAPGCPHPQRFNLTLDLYTPLGVPAALGKRPVFIAIHSGGYAKNSERGFAPSYEMTAACKHFAARGFVALTMVYRLNNGQTGGGLAPANWTGATPLTRAWKGGFLPSPQSIWPAVRDSMAAIRWLRGAKAAELNIDKEVFVSGGWSAGACTSTFLSAAREGDFKDQMDASTDPTFATLQPYLRESSLVQAGVVWAGNAAVTDTIDSLQKDERWGASNTPLAMYRGSKDGTMTPWAQAEVQAKLNASGVKCDLFAVPGHGHGDLMGPKGGPVATKNGVALPKAELLPVLNSSYIWLTETLKMHVLP